MAESTEAYAKCVPIGVINRILGSSPNPVSNSARAARYSDGCASFLATCKQADREGRHTFFGDNIFHLPSGPVEDLSAWMDNLQPTDKSLIPTMVLKISLSDLALEEYMSVLGAAHACIETLNLHHDTCHCNWNYVIASHTALIWKKKLNLLMEWGQIVRVDGLVASARLRSEPDDGSDKVREQNENFMTFEDEYMIDVNHYVMGAEWTLQKNLERMTMGRAYGCPEDLWHDLGKIEKTHEFLFLAKRRDEELPMESRSYFKFRK